MKAVFLLCLISPLLAGNNKSDGEFIINEPDDKKENMSILQPISQPNNNPVTIDDIKVIEPDQTLKPINDNNTNQLQSLDNTNSNNNLANRGSGNSRNKSTCVNCEKNKASRPTRGNRQRVRNRLDGKRGRDGLDSTANRNATDGQPGQAGLNAQNRPNRGNRQRNRNRFNGNNGNNGFNSSSNQNATNGQPGQDGLSVINTGSNKQFDVMVPEGAINKTPRRPVSKPTTRVRRNNTELVKLNDKNIDGGNPAAPRFVSFGVDKGTDLQYQNLLSKILNFGMLSMFTDLTDQATKISLMLVLRQDRQVAGNDIYKVIYKVENPKYVTGAIFYGAEFAVKAGVVDPNPNQIEFLSFGKSVILNNLLSLLSIDQDIVNSRLSLNHVNETKNTEGLDFNGQSKSAMVEFIQTILSLTQSELNNKKGHMKDCDEDKKNKAKEKDEPLIGSSSGSFDFDFGDKI